MKKSLLVLAFLLICTQAFAKSVKTYSVENDDGSLSIIYYVEGSKDTIQDVARTRGTPGKEPVEIDPKTLPPRADRKYWKKNGSSVAIDQVKKQADIDKKAQDQAAKDAVLLKLKISAEELEKLK